MAMIDLRQLQPGDRDRLYDWRREREVDRWMFQSPPPDVDTHRAWFEGFMADDTRQGWIIEQAGRPCGFLQLRGITPQRGELGWYIGEAEARGQGAGRAAQALGLEQAFGALGLARVWSEVVAENEAALKAQAAAGFRREGYLRRHAYKQDRVNDVVIQGILREEWVARRGPILADLAASGLIRRQP